MNKNLFFVLALVSVLLVSATAVSAHGMNATDNWTESSMPDITHMIVYLNGNVAWTGHCTVSPNGASNNWSCTTYQISDDSAIDAAFERGEDVTVKVVFVTGNKTFSEPVDVYMKFRGNGKTIEAQTSNFDIYANDQYTRFLTLSIPSDWKLNEIGTKDYTLNIEIEGVDTGVKEAAMDFDIQRSGNELSIKSLDLNADVCQIGNCYKFSADIVVKNTGSRTLNDVYLKATIKELGISKTVYVGDLYSDVEDRDEDEETTVEKIISFTLPNDVQPGVYTLQVEAYNDDASAKGTVSFEIEAGRTPQQPGKGYITVTPQVTTNTVEAGESTTYTMIVTNNGQSSQNVVVSITGIEGWATSEIMPASFSLAAGESRLVSVNINVNKDAVKAEHLFTAEVNTEKVNLIADVGKANSTSAFGLKEALLIVGIILAVIIVILLIVLLTRRNPEEKPEESYY